MITELNSEGAGQLSRWNAAHPDLAVKAEDFIETVRARGFLDPAAADLGLRGHCQRSAGPGSRVAPPEMPATLGASRNSELAALPVFVKFRMG